MSFKELLDNSGIEENIDFEKFERFVNAAFTSTLQEEYYSKKSEQTKKVLKIHSDMKENNRDIYATTLLLNINDIHKALIIKNLIIDKDLTKSKKDMENNIILDTLKTMQINRAYKTMNLLAKSKINNSRTKWLIRQFIRERGDRLEFDAVKYRKILKSLVTHSHTDIPKISTAKDKIDIERFLFKKDTNKIKNELFKNYLKAKTDKDSVFKLPYSIAEGFKSLHKISDKEFMEKIKGNMSATEKRRVQGRADKSNVKIDFNLSKSSPVDIQKFLRSDAGKKTSNTKGSEEFEKSCKTEANKLFKYFDFDNVKIIVDNSGSMYGSNEKKYHPISVSEAIAHVLKYLSDETEIIGSPNKSEFLMHPKNQSNIAEALLKALENLKLDKESIVFIISDGYENSPSGLVHQVIFTFKKKLDKKDKVIFIHLNPVFAPEADNIKQLSDLMQTFGVRDTKQLFMVLLLAIIRNKKDKKVKKMMKKTKQKVMVREKKKKKTKR